MGLIAHEYSKNKRELLEQARESFKLALSLLPLPYVSTEKGQYNQQERSPLYTVWDVTPTHTKKEMISDSPIPAPANPSIIHSTSAYSVYSPAPKPSTSEFEGSVLAMLSDMFTAQLDETEEISRHSNQASSPHSPTPHRARLSQSLSNTHVLAKGLVPSPLFSRGQQHHAEQVQIQNNPTHTLRPLPPLPFGSHKANFEVQGSRIVQIPTMRKTAIQTLIARYEGCLSGLQAPSEETTSSSTPSPVTPRFRMIRDAFSPDPPNDHLDAYLFSSASASLTRYNASLSDFRNQLRKHICFLDEELDRVQTVQDDRATVKKALTNSRLASFWSLSTAFSSAQAAAAGGGQRRRENNGHDDDAHPHSREDDPVLTAKKERINRLRLAGWNVRKEKHGYKGEEWYDNFRRRLERELDGYANLTS